MKNYLEWLATETPTRWWNDSAISTEIDSAIANGAMGVTTNPVLAFKSLQAEPDYWKDEVDQLSLELSPEDRAEELLRIVTQNAAKKFFKIYKETNMQHGYALGQLNPAICHNTEKMLAQALRYNSWGENIAVKLPTVHSALPVIEELASRGIAVCTTLNFSVSQGLAAGEAYKRGVNKALVAGIAVKPCFVVQQGGRFDEYLCECAIDSHVDIDKKHIGHAGNVICKKLYRLFKEKEITAKIMPAGLRTVEHLTSMAGSDMVFSLQPRVQQMVMDEEPLQIERIHEEVSLKEVNLLKRIPEFDRAYREGGIDSQDFYCFGITQKTISQFLWTGWIPLETYGMNKQSTRWF